MTLGLTSSVSLWSSLSVGQVRLAVSTTQTHIKDPPKHYETKVDSPVLAQQ